jgi:hypothetical protein
MQARRNSEQPRPDKPGTGRLQELPAETCEQYPVRYIEGRARRFPRKYCPACRDISGVWSGDGCPKIAIRKN